MNAQKEIFNLEKWLQMPGVSTFLPYWVTDLLPEKVIFSKKIFKKRQLLRMAAICGTSYGEIVRVGQVSFVQPAKLWSIYFKTPKEARLMANFGHVCFLTKAASILRTAIMIGLGLPRIKDGVMSCTRKEAFTKTELSQMWGCAQRRLK